MIYQVACSKQLKVVMSACQLAIATIMEITVICILQSSDKSIVLFDDVRFYTCVEGIIGSIHNHCSLQLLKLLKIDSII